MQKHRSFSPKYAHLKMKAICYYQTCKGLLKPMCAGFVKCVQKCLHLIKPKKIHSKMQRILWPERPKAAKDEVIAMILV